MDNYLGEVEVDVKDTPYAKYTKADWALEYIFKYGQIDGDHHKTWVLDMVARILNGAPVTVRQASWRDGQKEYRLNVGTSKRYEKWVKEYEGEVDEDGDTEYSYDTGTPP